MGTGFDFAGASFLAANATGMSLTSGTIEGWVQLTGIPAMTADLFGFSSSPAFSEAGAPPASMDIGGMVATGLGSSWSSDLTLAGQTIAGQIYVTGEWAHLGVTWTPSADASLSVDATVYLDGSLYMAKTISLVDAGSLASFLIAGAGAGSNLTGMVDEVTVYDNPLAPSQIAAIYAADSAGKCECLQNSDCPSTTPTCVTTTASSVDVPPDGKARSSFGRRTGGPPALTPGTSCIISGLLICQADLIPPCARR